MTSLTILFMKAMKASRNADDDLIGGCGGAFCLGGKDGWISAKLCLKHGPGVKMRRKALQPPPP